MHTFTAYTATSLEESDCLVVVIMKKPDFLLIKIVNFSFYQSGMQRVWFLAVRLLTFLTA